ncbi:HAD family acid phosphatase [Asaia bogorensis]|uniref:Acid phosphatase n=1 Tax=Asaia bogorensis NBRC 16594 TaxID=1231624 RepID=A0AAN4R1R1_9PROT|nr:HAD family acid phosphatase [Asaia bogorensis]BAT19990.1 acid phosphatase [Asaia bogorensis NBRC 16594]GEL52592.1 acid phosphatase [Asaia bogorensis NBRC 16594]
MNYSSIVHAVFRWRANHFGRALALAALFGVTAAGAAHAAPANVGDAEIAATAYHDSGAYDREFAAVIEEASEWVRLRAAHVSKPAIVLDIDETSLSNWPEIQANHFAYFHDGQCDVLPKGPCGVMAWEMSAKAQAFPSTLALYRMAQQHDVSVFFVTGRSENERADTAHNLETAGYKGWSGLVLRPEGSHTPSASDYKAAARSEIEQKGYHIIANIGDQPSDLAGGHADRGFLLPNPFYRVP